MTGKSIDINYLKKPIAIVMFFIFAFVSYNIVKPYLLSLIMGAIFAFIFYPVFTFINKFIKSKKLASLTLTVLILLVIAVPFTFLLGSMATEAVDGYSGAISYLENSNFFNDLDCATDQSLICNVLTPLGLRTKNDVFNTVTGFLSSISGRIIEGSAGVIATVTDKFLQIVVIIMTMFSLFIAGPSVVVEMRKLMPLSEKNKNKISYEFNRIISGVVYGQLLTALVQGFVAIIGYLSFGIKSPILWGFFTAALSLIPFIGAAGVWVPLSLVKLASSLINNDIKGIGQSIGLFVYGFLVISLIDNFLKPKFIGDKAKLNPVIAFTSILGGLSLFGIAGVILGPVIVALFLGMLKIYSSEI